MESCKHTKNDAERSGHRPRSGHKPRSGHGPRSGNRSRSNKMVKKTNLALGNTFQK